MGALGIIIVVALIGGIGYFAYKFIQKKKEDDHVPEGGGKEGDGGQPNPEK